MEAAWSSKTLLHWYTTTILYSITTQKATYYIVAMKTSDFTYVNFSSVVEKRYSLYLKQSYGAFPIMGIFIRFVVLI
jgi:hypothetical protein